MNALSTCALAASLIFTACSDDLFEIQVVDAETGRGVPLVELRTVNDVRFFTDSGGYVAIDSPELFDQEVFFHVSSHGYEFPKDGFGYRGRRLKVVAGGKAKLELNRINIAQRLYRMTGAGIYRDSSMLEKPIPIKQPLINGQVFGSDSVVNAVYRGQVYWFWGDTNRPSYPLGNFHVPGATSKLPEDGGLDPDQGVNLNYFIDKNGFAKPTAQMPGQGPTWIGGLVALNVGDENEKLFAAYVKVKQPMVVYERGLVRFDDEEKRFEHVKRFEMDTPLFPGGHPLVHRDNGQSYIYFAQPYPLVRVLANAASLQDLSQYETYTYLKKGSREDSAKVQRDGAGKLVYGWRTDTTPLTPKLEKQLMDKSLIDPAEAFLKTKDIETGKPVMLHGGSVYWNDYRKRWIMIAVESFGTSLLGEVWFSESDSLKGPWPVARKIVTHDKYSFYNPKQHPMFDADNGRTIFFEGTYTSMFSGNPDRTPRYNYNQVMYKLDLSDPRLKLNGDEKEK
jgi:hypothetical protein